MPNQAQPLELAILLTYCGEPRSNVNRNADLVLLGVGVGPVGVKDGVRDGVAVKVAEGVGESVGGSGVRVGVMVGVPRGVRVNVAEGSTLGVKVAGGGVLEGVSVGMTTNVGIGSIATSVAGRNASTGLSCGLKNSATTASKTHSESKPKAAANAVKIVAQPEPGDERCRIKISLRTYKSFNRGFGQLGLQPIRVRFLAQSLSRFWAERVCGLTFFCTHNGKA